MTRKPSIPRCKPTTNVSQERPRTRLCSKTIGRVTYRVNRSYKMKPNIASGSRKTVVRELFKPTCLTDCSGNETTPSASASTQTELVGLSEPMHVTKSNDSPTDNNKNVGKMPVVIEETESSEITTSSTERGTNIKQELVMNTTFTKPEKAHDTGSIENASMSTTENGYSSDSIKHDTKLGKYNEMLTVIHELALYFLQEYEQYTEGLLLCMNELMSNWNKECRSFNSEACNIMKKLRTKPISDLIESIQRMTFTILKSMQDLYKGCLYESFTHDLMLSCLHETSVKAMRHYRKYRGRHVNLKQDYSSESAATDLIQNMSDLMLKFNMVIHMEDFLRGMSSHRRFLDLFTTFLMVPVLCHFNNETLSYHMCNFDGYYNDRKKHLDEQVKKICE